MSSYANAPRQPGSGSVLIVVTSAFPYGRGEEFFETEVEYLPSFFDRVIIAPQRLAGSARPLPPDVAVDPTLGRTPGRFLTTVVAVALGIASRDVYRELLENPHILLSPRALKRLLTYNYVSVRTRRWLSVMLRKPAIQPERTIVYHYWLDATVHGVGKHRARSTLAGQVTRAHGSDIYESVHRPPYLPYRCSTLAGPCLIAPVSAQGKGHLSGACPESAPKLEVNRLGTRDPGYLTPPSDDGVLRLVSCSYITAVKRLPLLVAALADLATLTSSDQRIEWHHLGDGAGREALAKLASNLLPSRVSWMLHGHLSNQEVMGFYRHHPLDIFVNVSSSEGVPVSIMEAQSFGIPVLATAVGGTPEIVNSSNGELLPRDPTPGQVARAVMRLRSRSSLGAVRHQSRKSWETSYHGAVNYSQFAKRLQALTRN